MEYLFLGGSGLFDGSSLNGSSFDDGSGLFNNNNFLNNWGVISTEIYLSNNRDNFFDNNGGSRSRGSSILDSRGPVYSRGRGVGGCRGISRLGGIGGCRGVGRGRGISLGCRGRSIGSLGGRGIGRFVLRVGGLTLILDISYKSILK